MGYRARVTERWVCKRCFADNDGTAIACARCGLTRGSEVTVSDQETWASAAGVPAPATREAPGWRRWLRFWWIPAIAIGLLVGWFTTAQRGDDGSLTTAGNVSVTDLRAGDCFNGSDEEEISDVDGVPCDEPHEYEVFAVQDREGETFPTDAEFEAIFESICVPAFGSYVGIPYTDSELWATMITPSESSWDDGDREYVCALYEPEDGEDPDSPNIELTASMEGAAR
jgi:Septum formation